MSSDAHTNQVLGRWLQGYFENSEAAKEHARKILDQHGASTEPLPQSQKNPNPDPERVIAGYKTTLHNPRTSDKAKEKAERVLEQAGEDIQ